MPPSSSQGDSLKADSPGSNSSPPTIIRGTDQQKEQATAAMLVKVVDLADTSSHIKLKTETNCRKSGGKSPDELAITKAHNRKKPTLLANSMNNPTGSQKADKLDQNKCKLTGSKQVVAGFAESLSMVASMPSPLIFSSIITAPVAPATTKSTPNHRQQSKSPQGRTHTNKTSTRQSRQTPPSPANDNGEQKSKQIIGSGTNPPVGQAVTARLIDMGKRLLDAARDGQVDHVRQLVISSGAPYTSDWLGTTALHMAAQNGHLEIAEILLRNGVNRDARTKFERTALHLAAQSGSFEVVDLLLNHGSDVDARDMLKMTPLHWAVERGHLCVIERLLIGGADIEIKNKFQLTPVDIARDSKSYEIINLFKSWRNKDKDKVNFECLRSGSFSETHDILNVVDYDFSLEDNASTSRASLMLDIDEPCIDLVELEWNTLKFEPDFFLTNEDEEEPKVEYLMKVVEELQKENRQLRQRVEQLSTNPLASQLRRTHAQ